MSRVDQLREDRKVHVVPGELFECHYPFRVTNKAFEDGKWAITIKEVADPSTHAGLTRWRGPDAPKCTAFFTTDPRTGRFGFLKAAALVLLIGSVFVAGQFELADKLPDFKTFKASCIDFQTGIDEHRNMVVGAALDAVNAAGDAVYAVVRETGWVLACGRPPGFSEAEIEGFIDAARRRGKRLVGVTAAAIVNIENGHDGHALLEMAHPSGKGLYIDTGVDMPKRTDGAKVACPIAWIVLVCAAFVGFIGFQDGSHAVSFVRILLAKKGLPLWALFFALLLLPFDIAARFFTAFFQIVVGVFTFSLRRNKSGDSNA